MTPTDGLRPGLVGEQEEQVSAERTAPHIGSGELAVYATPAMAALIEQTCAQLVQPHLASGTSTVGVELHLRHLAPTPAGSHVRARAELVEVDGDRLTFGVQVWDHHELVGEAEHRRVVIEIERFLRRVASKTA